MKFALAIWLTLVAISRSAGLEFAEPLKEMTAPADASSLTADYKFTNKGDKPVTIIETDPPCGCLKVQISGGKLKYAPGESGTVRAILDMGNSSGTIDKVIPILVDNDSRDKPSIQLKLRVTIPVLVGLETRTVKWEAGGKAEPKTIQIRMGEGKPIHVLRVQPNSASFACELKTLESGRKYDLVVTPANGNVRGFSVIRIETDCENPKQKIQQVFAVFAKP
jgi:Protein of unknown function (DUF1573)